MNSIITTETVKLGRRTYTINLYQDSDVESPLENDDGVFITCRKGARNEYGNTPLDQEEHERIGQRIELYGDKEAQLAEALRISNDPDYEPLGEPLIGLPVYVYQHGNVAIRTSKFSCPWDSGQSGFIYITEKTALEWQGGKRMSKGKLERVLKSIESVVEEYSMWCNGECYYYTVDDEKGNDCGLSCGGYIGDKYVIESATSEVKAYHSGRVKDACAERIAATKERIERLLWAARGVVTA